MAESHNNLVDMLGSIEPGLMDFPISSLDQQALLQLLSPFLTASGAGVGNAAEGNVAAPKEIDLDMLSKLTFGVEELSAAAAAGTTSSNSNNDADTKNKSIVSPLFQTGLKGSLRATGFRL